MPSAVDRAHFMSIFRQQILPILNPWVDDGVVRENSVELKMALLRIEGCGVMECVREMLGLV